MSRVLRVIRHPTAIAPFLQGLEISACISTLPVDNRHRLAATASCGRPPPPGEGGGAHAGDGLGGQHRRGGGGAAATALAGVAAGPREGFESPAVSRLLGAWTRMRSPSGPPRGLPDSEGRAAACRGAAPICLRRRPVGGGAFMAAGSAVRCWRKAGYHGADSFWTVGIVCDARDD